MRTNFSSSIFLHSILSRDLASIAAMTCLHVKDSSVIRVRLTQALQEQRFTHGKSKYDTPERPRI